MARITQQSSIHTTGTSYENEPVIKSDAASSDVMEWAASTGTSTVEIAEDASNNLKLKVDGVPVVAGASGSDGQGLHFDGAAGKISNTSAPDLGSKWSAELIIQADAWGSADHHIVDWSNGERVIIASKTATDSGKLAFYRGGWVSFGVETLEDLKVHHLVIVVDETANTATLYDNGNQVASITPTGSYNVDDCTTLRLGADNNGTNHFFNGTILRARFWSKTLTATEVTTAFENATVPAGELSASPTELAVNGTFEAWNGANTIPDNWLAAPSGSGTITRSTENHGGTYSAALAVDSGNANCYVQTSAVSLPAGKKIEWSVWMKASSAIDKVSIYAVGDNAMILEPALTTSWQQFTGSYTAKVDSKLLLGRNFTGNAASKTIYVDDASAVHRGCVVDLDLAFANPTQSLAVQDRAGAADGTASSGVTQVTPIEQLNAKAARIGTSAATPANGELAVGNIIADAMPTSSAGLATGTLWNDSGTVKIA